MAQKTNLNVSPYFDDFDSSKQYYKILFSPSRAIQARELNTLQSQLQYQIEKFGSHIFKDGSMVIPGGITYDSRFYAVKVNQLQFGVDVGIYVKSFIGKKIFGRSSGIGAVVNYIALPSDSDEVDYITLYVKYIDSGKDNKISQFYNGESLYAETDTTYGNTTIPAETAFATIIENDGTAIGSSANINRGVYFIRGFFVEVLKQTIILDYYNNLPTYKIGFTVNEKILTAKDDNSLYDNAKGFTNYAAPGADRFSISLKLDKRPIDDEGDPNFIELMRTDNGEVKKEQTTTQYSLIRDYLAKRTYDESGNYSVDPFKISITESLNDRIGNNGAFFEGEKTDQGNTPSDDIISIKISPGIAYVGGYDVVKTNTTVIDVEKPRETEKLNDVSTVFRMGNYLRVNNVEGSPSFRDVIDLYDSRKTSNTVGSGTKIGEARLYNISLTDERYSGPSSSWDLYLYDIQTYTKLTLNQPVSSAELPKSAHIKGKSSGATGFAVSAGAASTIIYIRETSGNFTKGEALIINGVQDISRSISDVREYDIKDIKSVFRNSTTDFTHFSADTVLLKSNIPGFSSSDRFILNPATNTVTSPGKYFSNIKVGSIISYIGDNDIHYNEVVSVSADGTSMVLGAINSVTGVANGTIGVSVTTQLNLSLRVPNIISYNDGSLYAFLPSTNTASLNLSNSTLTFKAQTKNPSTTTALGSLTLDSSYFDLPAGITTSSFQGFDEENYSIHYDDKTVESLTSDKFSLDIEQNQISFSNIAQSKSVDTVFATLIKRGINSKVKIYNKSKIVNFTKSKYKISGTNSESSISDGLSYSSIYGVRIQDEALCLNYPDVAKIIAVYESLDELEPSLDRLSFSSLVNVSSNAIIGEKIIGQTSGAVCQVIRKPVGFPNSLEFVYLNGEKFISDEVVKFSESGITANIDSITFGAYKNITNRFLLDKGQKSQYYDYSRLLRKSGEPEPTKKVIAIFDYYSVPSNDNGDAFTALSYSKDQYQELIPRIGRNEVPAYDILDFRPRVSPIENTDTLTNSPFEFSSRNFHANDPSVILAPDEVCILGIERYLGRIDRLYLNRNGEFVVRKGVSDVNPKPPEKIGDSMLLATLIYPPYLDNAKSALISLENNKRYTMKDIGKLDTRITNLERTTTLSLLEVNTEALQIRDADGLNQFKTGFFVDNFSDSSSINLQLSNVEVGENQISSFKIENTLSNVPEYKLARYEYVKTLSENNVSRYGEIYTSNDNGIRFSTSKGQLPTSLTLDYTDVKWISQPIATRVENVNPFHVIEYVGNLTLNPPEDRWVRTELLLPAKLITKTTTLRSTNVNTINQIRTANATVTIDAGVRLLGAAAFDARFGPGAVNGDTRRVVTTTVRTSSSTELTSERSNITTSKDTVSSTVRRLISVGDEIYIRSRNVEFDAVNLKPFTIHYQFLDNITNLKFISKIIKINLTSGAFKQGEDVIGYIIQEPNSQGIGPATEECIRFKLAAPNHKTGPITNPSSIYGGCPYDKSTILPSKYSTTLNYLNIDIESLSSLAEGQYSGYLTTYVKFVGQTSGAEGYLVSNSLITDAYGDLKGCFFIDDPNSNASVKIPTGTKTYILTSSINNASALPGSTDISKAEVNYRATGLVNTFQDETTESTTILETNNITRVNTTTITTTTTRRVQTLERFDPLAQSFEVGRTSQSSSSIQADSKLDKVSDSEGAFLTKVGLYFASVDSGNAPITIQIRTMELGTPTLTQIGESVTLNPNSIVMSYNTSNPDEMIIRPLRECVTEDASIAVLVRFPYPIYLPPDDEYALVLLAPESVGYEMFIAEMNESSLNERALLGLPEAERVKYSKQFAIGSLFKSQNGSIWSADQNQDLKFDLYKAQFSNVGTAVFYNPTINENTVRNQFGKLATDPIEIYPKKISVTFTPIATNDAIFNNLTIGRKVSESIKTYNYGFIEDFGGPVAGTPSITTPGFNYTDQTAVETFNISGTGSGLTLNITTTSGEITSVAINSAGSGYKVGDTVGIVTSTAGGSGFAAEITITTVTNYDTVFLTNVQGESFTPTANLTYFNGGVQSTTLTIQSSSIPNTIYKGNVAKVNHLSHGMYSTANNVSIANIRSDYAPEKITADITSRSTAIPVSNINIFQTFEGIAVSANNPGYVKILNEIISYSGTSGNSLTGITRGIDSTKTASYITGQLIYKYEISGVSLRRLNTTFNIADIQPDMDNYYIEFDRTSGVNRSSDNVPTGAPQLSFSKQDYIGGDTVSASKNLMFNEIVPSYDVYAPGGQSVSVSAAVRTITSTSVSGNETSFLDTGYTAVQLNRTNTFTTPRMVCSRANELAYLNGLPNSKSFTTRITLQTKNPNLSPQIFIDNSVTNFSIPRLNKPVSNYITDRKSNEIYDSSHDATYVSNVVQLEQPSTSLKVIISAYRHASADFRVLYALIRADSFEVDQSFTLFPGYENLTIDNDQDGFLDIINPSLNSGLPDKFVSPSENNQFREYEYTAANLPEFVGYAIKVVMSGTNQCEPPIISTVRSIALA
jgi:hypothetical protein